ncbi:ATP-binding cassette domain-containing protein [Gemella sp. GH3]|uniref:ABC transporter ATP-binding protein n=1 Tax=unclassified Gemella TaxID=2624949 RepID=UPI0015D0AE50|nr:MULTISPECIES: ABC transporter transmembrane domain-containing protein [unclassified Gemella]MBF0713716.1 ATP-binding cassette domain-containing protein [Gemella sp. GH3.1]NYS50668.1 ATP-binding cassette domain-containing protein [Gemella sp. GH3]
MYLIKKLSWFLKKEKKAYITAILSLILVSILNLIPPKIIGTVIDSVTEKQLTNSDLLVNVLVLLVASISMYILRYIWRVNLFGAANRLQRILRYNLFEHFTKMPPSFYQKYRTGDLMAHATNDINAVGQTAGAGVMSAVDATITALVTLITMFFTISWKLTLAVLIPLPFMVFCINRLGKKLHNSFKESQAAFSELNNNVQESIAGVRVTKSFNYGDEAYNKFRETNNNSYKKNMKTMKLDLLFDPTIIIFIGICYVISLVFGGYLVYSNDITIGSLVTFITYLDMLIWPLLAMGYLFNVIQRGNASYERIENILSEKSDIVESSTPITTINNGKIVYNIKNFSYDNSTTLQDIKFEIGKGKTLGIVGPTGSGKTTLLKLLLRERDLENGEILLNTNNIKEYLLKDLRGLISYVPQDQILFSTTIKNNIAFSNPNSSNEQIINAAKLSCVYDDINEMPNEFDTIIGERGVSLSGGQKQRLSISRALINESEILILDDSLSAVDAKTEDIILNNLREIRKDKTTIITAHRLSAVVHADLIIVMKDGTIVERGTHDELIENAGWYADTYNKQQIESSFEG